MAGTMQRNRFLVLMDNFSNALEYSEVAANSAGSSLERYGVYQESIEAKTNELTAAIESLSTNIGFDANATFKEFMAPLNDNVDAVALSSAVLVQDSLQQLEVQHSFQRLWLCIHQNQKAVSLHGSCHCD